MEEFERRFKAVTTFNKFKSKENYANSRPLDVEGFTIETDEIVFIEKGDYHSYTFPIIREEENGLVENLLFSYELDGTYKIFLVKYNLNEQEKNDIINKIPIDVSSKTEIEEIEKQEEITNATASRRSCWQVTATAQMCCHGIHNTFDVLAGEYCRCANPPTEYTMTFVQIDCPDLTIGGATGGVTTVGGGHGGGSSGGGGLGGGGGATVPVVNPPIDHIAELKKLTDNKPDGTKTNIKIKIDALKSTLSTSPYEGGAMYNSSQTPLIPTVVAPTETNWADPPTQYYIKLHRHQDNYTPLGESQTKPTCPVESDMDVYNFLKLHKLTNNKNATDLFVSRAGTFALRATNPSKAKAAFESLTTNKERWSVFCRLYDELVMDPLLATPRDEAKALEGFIKFINETLIGGQPLGISLYQAVFDAQGNITTWVQL